MELFIVSIVPIIGWAVAYWLTKKQIIAIRDDKQREVLEKKLFDVMSRATSVHQSAPSGKPNADSQLLLQLSVEELRIDLREYGYILPSNNLKGGYSCNEEYTAFKQSTSLDFEEENYSLEKSLNEIRSAYIKLYIKLHKCFKQNCI